MDNKAIIECIKEYLKKCPYLSKLAEIKVDYLNVEENDHEYWSVEQLDVPNILKRNVIGTKTERQCQFVLATRSFFNPLVDTQNIQNLRLFEKIADWFYDNTRSGNLPILNNDEVSISIEATTGGYLYGMSKDNTIARYQMSCKLIYEKIERKR